LTGCLTTAPNAAVTGVFLLTNLLVLDDNDRVRFETDPLLAVLVATGLSATLRRVLAAGNRTSRGATARTA